jgi:hypothetical protein
MINPRTGRRLRKVETNPLLDAKLVEYLALQQELNKAYKDKDISKLVPQGISKLATRLSRNSKTPFRISQKELLRAVSELDPEQITNSRIEALDNLETLTNKKTATKILNSAGFNPVIFNRYFTSFKDEIKGIKNIDEGLFIRLWNQYKTKLERTGDTNILIPRDLIDSRSNILNQAFLGSQAYDGIKSILQDPLMKSILPYTLTGASTNITINIEDIWSLVEYIGERPARRLGIKLGAGDPDEKMLNMLYLFMKDVYGMLVDMYKKKMIDVEVNLRNMVLLSSELSSFLSKIFDNGTTNDRKKVRIYISALKNWVDVMKHLTSEYEKNVDVITGRVDADEKELIDISEIPEEIEEFEEEETLEEEEEEEEEQPEVDDFKQKIEYNEQIKSMLDIDDEFKKEFNKLVEIGERAYKIYEEFNNIDIEYINSKIKDEKSATTMMTDIDLKIEEVNIMKKMLGQEINFEYMANRFKEIIDIRVKREIEEKEREREIEEKEREREREIEQEQPEVEDFKLEQEQPEVEDFKLEQEQPEPYVVGEGIPHYLRNTLGNKPAKNSVLYYPNVISYILRGYEMLSSFFSDKPQIDTLREQIAIIGTMLGKVPVNFEVIRKTLRTSTDKIDIFDTEINPEELWKITTLKGVRTAKIQNTTWTKISVLLRAVAFMISKKNYDRDITGYNIAEEVLNRNRSKFVGLYDIVKSIMSEVAPEEKKEEQAQGQGLQRSAGVRGRGKRGPNYNPNKPTTIQVRPQTHEDRFKPFGRYYIYLPQFNRNILSLRTKGGSHIADLGSIMITNDLRNLLCEIADDKKLNSDVVNELDDKEKYLLYELIDRSGVSGGKVFYDDPRGKQRDELIKRFNLLRGQLVAGNNNKEIIKELKKILVSMVDNKIIRYFDFQRLLNEINELLD